MAEDDLSSLGFGDEFQVSYKSKKSGGKEGEAVLSTDGGCMSSMLAFFRLYHAPLFFPPAPSPYSCTWLFA
jgi:hypothetical protein